jgi:glycine betaine/proline transport system ATP-binding protein
VVIRDAAHSVMSAGRPVRVTENGALLGVVTSVEILEVIAGGQS